MTLHFKIYLWVLLAVILGSCSGETDTGTDSGENIPVTAGLQIILPGRTAPSAITRAYAGGSDGIALTYGTGEMVALTRTDISDDPDFKIADLTVLQFGTRGTLLAYQYLDDIQSLIPEISGDRLVYSPEVTLIESPQSILCIVANTGDPNFFNGISEIGTFRKAVRTMGDESSLLVNGLVPMTGSRTGPVGKDSEIAVTLERLLAKLEVDINIALADDTKKLELATAQLVSVPVSSTWFDYYKNITVLPSGDKGYPDVGSPAGQALFTDYPEKNIPSSGPLTWYLPENIRGSGFNTQGGEKIKYARNDPSFIYDERADNSEYEEYEAGFATRIFLRGKYTTDGKGERDILITLYPGEDVLNNFTIKRNGQYNIMVNITDINPVQDNGDDHRIYLKDPTGEEGISVAYSPILDPISPMAQMITFYDAKFYLHPSDEGHLVKAEVMVIFPSGLTARREFVPVYYPEGLTSIAPFNYIMDPEDYGMVMAPEILRNGNVVQAMTVLYFDNGKETVYSDPPSSRIVAAW